MRRVLFVSPDHALAQDNLGDVYRDQLASALSEFKRGRSSRALLLSGCPSTGGHARECRSVSRGDRSVESSDRQAARLNS
jgi:hypothetical protein